MSADVEGRTLVTESVGLRRRVGGLGNGGRAAALVADAEEGTEAAVIVTAE
jgi:hypothetical protein